MGQRPPVVFLAGQAPRRLAFVLAAAVVRSACSAGSSGAVQYSTETGQNYGSVNFSINSGPPYNYFIGAWTHVQPPMGSGTKGNDYPFEMYCQEGQVGLVSGNFDSPYQYNANVMTFGQSGGYIADYTTLVDPTTNEATCRDWVYVGWHFLRDGANTAVTQYVKYVGSSNLVDSTITASVPGNWTPTHLNVGGDPMRYPGTPMYIMYARIYAMDAAPTASQVNAIYMQSATPDPSAWADWPLISGNPADVSGHGRNLTVNGAVAPGVAGPPQSGQPDHGLPKLPQ
ncbi:MAG TPA: hypothetical protein VJ860_00380 [Polyangia bacterium]|nr:hypothetical protein [Polyangia bacterium]